jgi:cephalosporin hydroxylase
MDDRRIDIMHELFDSDPYEDLGESALAPDLQGWGSARDIFTTLIDELTPALIIEVGSWKGGSAIHMGRLIKERRLDCRIVCIDTWLGSLEHWNQRHPGPKHDWYVSLIKAEERIPATVLPVPQ